MEVSVHVMWVPPNHPPFSMGIFHFSSSQSLKSWGYPAVSYGNPWKPPPVSHVPNLGSSAQRSSLFGGRGLDRVRRACQAGAASMAHAPKMAVAADSIEVRTIAIYYTHTWVHIYLSIHPLIYRSIYLSIYLSYHPFYPILSNLNLI